ncbi:lamin tail domain-containing protein [archaeon]|nr:lamin tail domain-containing protein [archaeon]
MKSVFSFLSLVLIFSFVVGFVGAVECEYDEDCPDDDYCADGYVVYRDGVCISLNCELGDPYVIDDCNDGNVNSCNGDFWVHATEECVNDGTAHCVAASSTANCNDGDFCNGEETCEGEGVCTNPGNPCDDGDSCFDVCYENNDSCTYDIDDILGPVTSDVDVNPIYNNGNFDVSGTATDECSAVASAEYFVGQGTAGCFGNPHPMDAVDMSFDELIEDLEQHHYNTPVTIQDGQNFLCIQSYDSLGNLGDCSCKYFESDTVPPERVFDVTLNGVENPNELLICGDDPLLKLTVCDSESWLQGGEFFLNMWIPPEDIPAPWTGYWMDAPPIEDQYYSDGWHCADLERYVPLNYTDPVDHDVFGHQWTEPSHPDLVEGTHWINQIRGKDIVENWGKIWSQNLNYSFIKDTKAPLVYKELLPFGDVVLQCGISEMMGETITHGCQYVKSGTQIRLWADDSTFVDDHEFAGQVIIYYRVWWSEDGSSWSLNDSGQSAPDEELIFTLTGDSYHLVEFWAVDGCGWESEHYWELDIIDEKAPVSEKELEAGAFVLCETGEYPGYPDCAYVTQDTLVTLTCADVEPHPIGGEEIYYTIDWKLNWADEWQLGPISPNGGNSVEFYYEGDSFHKLTWWCVDAFGNTEVSHVELDIVDTEAPLVSKIVGEPKVWTGASSEYYDFEYLFTHPQEEYDVSDEAVFVTQNTLIDLNCVDVEPHPVNDVEIWCTYFNDGVLIQDWQLCMDPFTYNQDTYHELYYYCVDALGNEGETHYELDIVDTLPPESEHHFEGPTHLGKFDELYIDGVTELVLECEDFGPHPVGEEYMLFRYRVDEGLGFGAWTAWTNYTNPFVFPEESHHELQYYCVDSLGNEEVANTADFYVDHTKPVTIKTYGEPLYEPVVGAYPKWITQQTSIILTATDDFGSNHDSGLADTFYRVRVLNNPNNWQYCYDGCEGWDGVPDYLEMNVPTPWQTYDVPFTVTEDSCHVIEYYSVDMVNKTEEVKRQCVFVDTEAPETIKTVGEPKIPLEEELDIPYDEGWLVNGSTEITFDCNDVDPHPVGEVTMYWRWKYSEFGVDWTPWSEDIVYDGSPITFHESSYHMVEYWCVDALGNEEEHTFELDAVDLTPPESWKEMGDPSILVDPDCNPEVEICDYWITQGTEISLFCEDFGPHPSGVDEIFWRYDLDGEGFGSWMPYDGPITFGEDSNHTLEWYCVDNFGNEEVVKSELDTVDSQGPNVTRKFAMVNGGEVIEGGSVGDEVVIAIQSEDSIKLCAELVDFKQTGDPGVGIGEVWYQFVGLDDPELIWDPIENAYCIEMTGGEIREGCGMGECGKWRFEVMGIDLLGNVGEWTNGIEIIVDNVPPMGVVLNPHAGNYYRDEIPFQVYAPAVDFGGDFCSLCYYGYEDDCPASGVDYCDLYAIDYNFEGMNQSEIKECYRDLWTYFQQVGANPNVVYLGQVPYEDGVCKGTAALPLGSGMTDTVFLGIDYVDKAGNRGNELFGYHLQLALNPWFSPITMNIDNDGPIVAVDDSNLPGPLTSSGDGDNVFVEVEVIEYASGFDSCWAEVYEDDGGEVGEYVGVADIIGTEPEYNLCRINGAVPDGLASGDYFVKVNVRDELFNIGSVVIPMIVDNTRPTMSVVAPMEGEVYGEMFPVSLNVEDSQSPIADETVMFKISEVPGVLGICWSLGGCEDTGWVNLNEQNNGLYAITVNLTEYDISGEGRYMFNAVACDNLYVAESDTDLGFSMGNSRTDAHCRMISLHGQVVEEPRPQCDDGIDNDLDGDIDYPEDYGCDDASDDDEMEMPVCGNGNLEEGEECDDGNVEDGDGCSSTCMIEEQNIKINEFVSYPECDDCEWIELYNPHAYSVDLTDWTLNDGASWTLVLGGDIDAYGFRVFDGFGSDELDDEGDTIKLDDYSDGLVDEVTYGDRDDGNVGDNAPAPSEGESAGRSPDGHDTDVDSVDFYIFSTPTQGTSNPI